MSGVVDFCRRNHSARRSHSGNAEVDTALAQGRVWISKGGNLQLLGLYESRIQRRFEKNMAEIRILQVDRKTSLEQLLEEADLLCQFAESKGEEADPSQFSRSPDLIFQAPISFAW